MERKKICERESLLKKPNLLVLIPFLVGQTALPLLFTRGQGGYGFVLASSRSGPRDPSDHPPDRPVPESVRESFPRQVGAVVPYEGFPTVPVVQVRHPRRVCRKVQLLPQVLPVEVEGPEE